MKAQVKEDGTLIQAWALDEQAPEDAITITGDMDWDVDPDQYKVVDGQLVRTPTARYEIFMAKKNLEETDWVASKMMDASIIGTDEECSELQEKYKEVLENRKKWRELINQYEATETE